MDREQAINVIEQSFPPDSRDPWRASEGRRIRQLANEYASDWRDEPTPVLQRMAYLCQERIERGRANAERYRESHR